MSNGLLTPASKRVPLITPSWWRLPRALPIRRRRFSPYRSRLPLMMAGNAIQVGTSGIRVRGNGIVIAGEGDDCCCTDGQCWYRFTSDFDCETELWSTPVFDMAFCDVHIAGVPLNIWHYEDPDTLEQCRATYYAGPFGNCPAGYTTDPPECVDPPDVGTLPPVTLSCGCPEIFPPEDHVTCGDCTIAGYIITFRNVSLCTGCKTFNSSLSRNYLGGAMPVILVPAIDASTFSEDVSPTITWVDYTAANDCTGASEPGPALQHHAVRIVCSGSSPGHVQFFALNLEVTGTTGANPRSFANFAGFASSGEVACGASVVMELPNHQGFECSDGGAHGPGGGGTAEIEVVWG